VKYWITRALQQIFLLASYSDSMLPSISCWTSTNTLFCLPSGNKIPNADWSIMVVKNIFFYHILDLFWPVCHNHFNSTSESCSESMLPCISQWSSTNTQTCFPSWIVLPNTYWYKMIPNNNISFCYIFGMFWPIRHNHFNSTLESCSESMLSSIIQWSSTNTNHLFPQLNSSS
jgi:hypothetical protein